MCSPFLRSAGMARGGVYFGTGGSISPTRPHAPELGAGAGCGCGNTRSRRSSVGGAFGVAEGAAWWRRWQRWRVVSSIQSMSSSRRRRAAQGGQRASVAMNKGGSANINLRPETAWARLLSVRTVASASGTRFLQPHPVLFYSLHNMIQFIHRLCILGIEDDRVSSFLCDGPR